MDLKWPEIPSKVNFGHPKWPIDLKWQEMRSKLIFRHPKWPPKKWNSVSIWLWNGQNCYRKWISDIQNGRSIWNGQKCHRKWFSNIQNVRRRPFCQKYQKNKFCIDLKWSGMWSKVNFVHPKWPTAAILSKISKKKLCIDLNGQQYDRKCKSDIQNWCRRSL